MWYIVITLLLLYSVGAHDAFIYEKVGGGGVELSLRFIISSPTWPVLCCSVMSDLNLDNRDINPWGRLHLPPLHLVLHRTTQQIDTPVLHATDG